MDVPVAPPNQLANRIIRQLVDHLFGEGMVILKEDYLALRAVYRQMGGTWASLVDGNNESIGLLEKIVTAWGQMPNRKTIDQEDI
jgi:hypothetical protein